MGLIWKSEREYGDHVLLVTNRLVWGFYKAYIYRDGQYYGRCGCTVYGPYESLAQAMIEVACEIKKSRFYGAAESVNWKCPESRLTGRPDWGKPLPYYAVDYWSLSAKWHAVLNGAHVDLGLFDIFQQAIDACEKHYAETGGKCPL